MKNVSTSLAMEVSVLMAPHQILVSRACSKSVQVDYGDMVGWWHDNVRIRYKLLPGHHHEQKSIWHLPKWQDSGPLLCSSSMFSSPEANRLFLHCLNNTH